MWLAESFNGGAVANSYSQIAGVLAGFAFTGLLLFVTRTAGLDRDSEKAAAGTLFAALTTLIMCALLYAVLAAVPNSMGSSLLASLTYGVPFGLSILLLFHAMSLILQQVSGLRSAGRAARVMTAVTGPCFILIYELMGIMNALAQRCSTPCTNGGSIIAETPVVVGLALIPTLLIGSFLSSRGSLSGFIRHRLPQICGRFPESSKAAAVGPGAVALLATFAAAAGSLSFPLLQPEYKPSDATLVTIITLAFTILFVFSFSTAQASLLFASSHQEEINQPAGHTR